MTIVNCNTCKGAKKIMGMGMMKQDCPACKGIGFVDHKEEKVEPIYDVNDAEIKVKKKPGRKPRVVE